MGFGEGGGVDGLGGLSVFVWVVWFWIGYRGQGLAGGGGWAFSFTL